MEIKANVSTEEFAKKFAVEDSGKQAKFLNAFIEQIKEACETEYRVDLQLASINDDLSDEVREKLAFMVSDECVNR